MSVQIRVRMPKSCMRLQKLKASMPEVTDCCVYPEVGEEVHAFRTAYDRIGHVVMRAETMENLRRVFDEQIASFPFVEIQENE